MVMKKPSTLPKKRGPVAKGYEDAHILLPPVLLEWAKHQPEGLSGLMRRLLVAEYRKQRGWMPEE
jgi:hypothetical protein